MGRRSRRNPDGHRDRGKGRATPKAAPTAERRVVLRRPPGVDEFGSRRPGFFKADGEFERWGRGVLGATAEARRVVRLTEWGVDWGTPPGPDDEVGYCMDPYRGDDCFQVAIATVCQVPVEQVPDLRLAQREYAGEDPDEIGRAAWLHVERWAAARGLTVGIHAEVPVARDRWIGVVSAVGEPGHSFGDHGLVMSRDSLIFDPLCGVRPPPGMGLFLFDPADITYGITFDKEDIEQ